MHRKLFIAALLLAPVVLWAKPMVVVRSAGSQFVGLRPESFPAIPSEVTAAGFAQNDLSTSVRTDITPTSRSGVIEISTGGSPYTASTADRTYRLTADVTYDSAGIIVAAANITIDLNGYTLTYNDTDVEDEETATASNAAGGSGSGDPPTMEQSGLSLSSDSHANHVVEFTSGDESGNFYEVETNDGTTLTMENHTNHTDDGDVIDSWENGGPANGDGFRIYDPRETFGAGVPAATYIDNVEIVNGSIVQGSGYGRGLNLGYCVGMSPVSRPNGNGAWTIGGVAVTWSSENTGGIRIQGTGNSITYCELTDNGTFLSNRQRNCMALDAGNGATISYNRMHNHRHVGINLNDDCTVSYNEIYGDSHGTNAAAVNCYAGENNTVTYNNIYKEGEHAIGLSLHSDGTIDNEYAHNWVECKTTSGSAEYGYNNAAALSNRWGTRSSENYVHNNALVTYSEEFEAGAVGESLGRTAFVSDLSSATSERIEDNVIAAYNLDDTATCHAIGVNNADEALIYRGNTIVGAHNIFWLGDDYGYGGTVSGVRYIDNAIMGTGSDPNFYTFDLERAGGDSRTTNADWISNDYSAGAGNDDADFEASAGDWSNMTLRFGYNLTVTVTSGGSPVEGATVSIDDTGANELRSGYVTDANGDVVVDVPTYYRDTDGTTTTSLTPLTVNASKDAESGSDTISPVADDSITVTIE